MLTVVPTTAAATDAPTEAARRLREEAPDAGRLSRRREMTVMAVGGSFEAGLSAHIAA